MQLSWWKKTLSLTLTFLFVYAFSPDERPVVGQEKKKPERKKKKDLPVLEFPPKLPGGKGIHTANSPEFLKAPETIRKDVAIAKTPPTVDFLYYPGQDYKASIWSNWGDGLALDGKYYSSIGDHNAPKGNAFVYEYDPAKKTLRLLTDVVTALKKLMGLYTPGKIHGRIDLGKDGWLYFSTHRGSTRVTTDEYGYKGDWILRCDPKTGKVEVVAHGPVPKHCIPTSVLDPDRLIFYGGTAPGAGKDDAEGVHFFAYDVKKRKLLYSGPGGPGRYMIFARSTGKVYYVPVGPADMVGALMRFDPDKGTPEKTGATLGLRAASMETRDGFVYTVSKGGRGGDSIIYSFNTKTEEVKELGSAAVGTNNYITSLSADPAGRYLYYVPGAHGGSERDGSAVVQFDVETGRKKVIAFLHPYFQETIGAFPAGTFGTAIDPAGDKLYITWNVNRGSRAWDCCALTVIHIPESERPEGGR